MVKNEIQPCLNIGETYVFSVAILLRNDCEKLKKVYVSTSLSSGKRLFGVFLASQVEKHYHVLLIQYAGTPAHN
jgi:hypothetical protein